MFFHFYVKIFVFIFVFVIYFVRSDFPSLGEWIETNGLETRVERNQCKVVYSERVEINTKTLSFEISLECSAQELIAFEATEGHLEAVDHEVCLDTDFEVPTEFLVILATTPGADFQWLLSFFQALDPRIQVVSAQELISQDLKTTGMADEVEVKVDQDDVESEKAQSMVLHCLFPFNANCPLPPDFDPLIKSVVFLRSDPFSLYTARPIETEDGFEHFIDKFISHNSYWSQMPNFQELWPKNVSHDPSAELSNIVFKSGLGDYLSITPPQIEHAIKEISFPDEGPHHEMEWEVMAEKFHLDELEYAQRVHGDTLRLLGYSTEALNKAALSLVEITPTRHEESVRRLEAPPDEEMFARYLLAAARLYNGQDGDTSTAASYIHKAFRVCPLCNVTDEMVFAVPRPAMVRHLQTAQKNPIQSWIKDTLLLALSTALLPRYFYAQEEAHQPTVVFFGCNWPAIRYQYLVNTTRAITVDIDDQLEPLGSPYLHIAGTAEDLLNVLGKGSVDAIVEVNYRGVSLLNELEVKKHDDAILQLLPPGGFFLLGRNSPEGQYNPLKQFQTQNNGTDTFIKADLANVPHAKTVQDAFEVLTFLRAGKMVGGKGGLHSCNEPKLLVVVRPELVALANDSLIQENCWKVISLTGSAARSSLFYFKEIMHQTGVEQYELWCLRSCTTCRFPFDINVLDLKWLETDIFGVLNEIKWKRIVVHNRYGEYGDLEAQLVHQIVVSVAMNQIYDLKEIFCFYQNSKSNKWETQSIETMSLGSFSDMHSLEVCIRGKLTLYLQEQIRLQRQSNSILDLYHPKYNSLLYNIEKANNHNGMLPQTDCFFVPRNVQPLN